MISQHTNSCYVSEGEQLLANKLLKKYGKTAIPFQTVISSTTETNASESRRKDILAATSRVPQHPKEWYELNEKECGSSLSSRSIENRPSRLVEVKRRF